MILYCTRNVIYCISRDFHTIRGSRSADDFLRAAKSINFFYTSDVGGCDKFEGIFLTINGAKRRSFDIL